MNKPLQEVLDDIQKSTSWRILYRESLISDIRVSIESSKDEVFNELNKSLQGRGLEFQIDQSRQQVILIQTRTNENRIKRISVSGQIVDDSTGERLPHATLSWLENNSVKGTASGSAGTFQFTAPIIESGITIKASYVGYHPKEVHFKVDNLESIRDLTIRLSPQAISSNEIIVSGSAFNTSSDTSLSGLIETGRFSPFGESSSVRALQVLPSVGLTTALNNGLNVRGSAPDGLQVMLDGITIFNQSHLFGLLDSFNEDALQSSGFFYDITPAQIEVPTGGTLALLTRSGSLNKTTVKAGLSNSSYKATLEGPLKRGKASWLISGRGSLLNAIDWFNNSDLIQWGLDINRPGRIEGENRSTLDSRLVTPLDSEARFFDLHGKLYFEGNSGNRWIASVYYGGDFTNQLVERRVGTIGNETRFRTEEFQTENDWGNFAGTIKHQRQISNHVYSHTMTGISAYEADFLKEDFVNTRINRVDGTTQINVFTFPFQNKSTMNQVKAEQSFDMVFNHFSLTAGAAWFYYRGDYRENSFNRSSFLVNTESNQFDTYFQADFMDLPFSQLHIGTRFHYYSNGDFKRFSPRLKLRLLPDYPVNFSIGFSRNHQFLHRIGLDNAVTADVWVLSNELQPPASVDHYSAGVYTGIIPKTYIQIEGFIKNSKNLRLHEINVQSLSNTFSDTPWFFENKGRGRGAELIIKNQFNNWSLTHTYSLSSMEFQNPFILDGDSFYADWDRRHLYTATAEVSVMPSINLYASWMIASGTPNRLAQLNIEEESERLDIYKRLDISAKYSGNFTGGRLSASISFFNVLNSQNPWYREFTLAIDESRRLPRLEAVPMDVFDLGFQPSFEIILSF
ncbi:MAG: carboxypeptidase-like regulatory domain-containing protein [Balneolaceae bacterium]